MMLYVPALPMRYAVFMSDDVKRKPQALPNALLKGVPSAKLLYLYLRDQGSVSHSYRDIADALGIDTHVVMDAYNYLLEQKLLVEEVVKQGGNSGLYKIVQQ